jgi:hypothetical protein
MIGPHEILDDDEIERVVPQRRGAQAVEVEQARPDLGSNGVHGGIIADVPPIPSSLRVKPARQACALSWAASTRIVVRLLAAPLRDTWCSRSRRHRHFTLARDGGRV